MYKVLLLSLLVAAAAPAYATRVMLGEIDAKGETLTCMSTVLKDGSGSDLKMSAVSALTQRLATSVQSSVGSQGEAACLRMKVKCVEGNNKAHCTQADSDAKATKFAYMLTTRNVCDYYKSYATSSGFVSDVYCCTSNGCNLDKALDSVTALLEAPRAQP